MLQIGQRVKVSSSMGAAIEGEYGIVRGYRYSDDKTVVGVEFETYHPGFHDLQIGEDMNGYTCPVGYGWFIHESMLEPICTTCALNIEELI